MIQEADMLKIKDKDFYRNVAKISLPILAQGTLTYLVGFIDNIMVGAGWHGSHVRYCNRKPAALCLLQLPDGNCGRRKRVRIAILWQKRYGRLQRILPVPFPGQSDFICLCFHPAFSIWRKLHFLVFAHKRQHGFC